MVRASRSRSLVSENLGNLWGLLCNRLTCLKRSPHSLLYLGYLSLDEGMRTKLDSYVSTSDVEIGKLKYIMEGSLLR